MKQTAEQRRTRIGALCAAVAVLSASPLQELGADEEYEWDPAWGLHEEEWYDPSDWFNDDGAVDVEELDDAWGYDYDYYGDDFWASPDYYYVYAYDPAAFAPDYSAVYYQWVPDEETWDEVEGDEEASKKAAADAKKKQGDNKSQDRIKKEDVVTMRGTIKGMTELKPEGADKPHQFVILDAAKGQHVLVDLGGEKLPEKIKLEEGRKIQVRGPRAKVNGRYLLIAQQVSQIDGTK